VYEREKATQHDDQLTTFLQWLEEQVYRFDDQLEWFGDEIGAQLEVLIEQFYIMGGANTHCFLTLFS
jgi:hypothetical protein